MSSEIEKPSRVATLAVWNGGQLMMGLRRDNMLWTTPGGHLDELESPVQGAIRELREETGLDAAPDQLQYLGSVQTAGRSGRAVELHMFQMDLSARPVLNLSHDPDQEVHDWKFVDVSNGLPAGLKAALHSPKNHLLRAVGLMDFDTDAKLSAPVKLKAGEYAPPTEARRMAGLGLEMAAALKRKLPALAVQRARALVEGRGMTRDDVKEVAQYFALYGNCIGENDSNGGPSDRHLEALLWGGSSSARWSKAMASLSAPARLADNHSTGAPYPVGTRVEIIAGPEKYKTGKVVAVKKNGMGQIAYTIEPDDFRDESYYVPHGYVSKLATTASFAADQNEDTSGTEKGPTREVTSSRPMHEVSKDLRGAGIDDNDQNPEADREIPGGPRRKTDAEMKENPHEDLAR